MECLTVHQHRMLHANMLSDKRKEQLRENMEENALPRAVEWHKSSEGRAWHRKHYLQTKNKLHKVRRFVCEQCGKKFTSEQVNARFCSNACKSKWRRDNHLDDEERTCLYCHEKFKCNKYSKRKFCSRKCAAHFNAEHKLNLTLSKR